MIYVYKLFGNLIALWLGFIWLVGIVLSNGFWSCFGSIIFPPYAWYLVVEYSIQLKGLLQ